MNQLHCQSGSVLRLAERWNDAVQELDGTCFSLSKRLGSSQSAISNERAASVFPLHWGKRCQETPPNLLSL
ncbi:MAG: hypothetical protein RLP02_31765, partial [Coleofasciculus sp. C2-GNP5-27]